MNSRSFDVDGTKIIIKEYDIVATQKAIGDIAKDLSTGLNNLGTTSNYLDSLLKASDELKNAYALYAKTTASQMSAMQCITNKDYANFIKQCPGATKQFRELNSIVTAKLTLPEQTDEIKKAIPPKTKDSVEQGIEKFRAAKSNLTTAFNGSVAADAAITKAAKVILENRKKQNANSANSAQVQPAPAANSNPPAFMHSNKSSVEAAKASAPKPAVQPNQNAQAKK